MERKIIYNPNSTENLNDRRTFGGNPDGMINFTRAKYEWALRLWDTMEANTWFPKEVDMTRDVNDYKHLTDAEKKELLPSGRQARFDNRVAWARAYLKKAGLVEDQKRGLQVYYRLCCPCILEFFGCIETVMKSNLRRQMRAMGADR